MTPETGREGAAPAAGDAAGAARAEDGLRADVGIWILRSLMGLGIAHHGWGKIFVRGMEPFVQMVAQLGLPCPRAFAWAEALSELAGGLLLALGLATRPAACLILISMSVAVFGYHAADPLSIRELPLAYWTIALALLCAGGGRFSLDHLLGRRLSPERRGPRGGPERRRDCARGERLARGLRWLLLGGLLLGLRPPAASPAAGQSAAGTARAEDGLRAASAAPTGSVLGRLFLRSSDARDLARSGLGLGLSRVIVYLVPQGHALNLPPPEARPVISQKNARFDPPLAVVVKGQTVDFPNDDNIDHNVFSFSKVKKFDLGIYPKGEKKSLVFDREGPVLIFCSVHEQMNGILFVVPNALYALTDSAGRFSITGVPVGRYSVRTWNAAMPGASRLVEVTSIAVSAGEPVRLDINLADASGRGGDAP